MVFVYLVIGVFLGAVIALIIAHDEVVKSERIARKAWREADALREQIARMKEGFIL